MILKFVVVFEILVLFADATDSVAVEALENIVGNVPSGKGEKLEEEIDKIGKDMQNSNIIAQEVQIDDEFDLKQKLENFTLKTTEKVVVLEPPIEPDGLEHEETVPDPEENEHLRHQHDQDFGDFELKERKGRMEEEIAGPLDISGIPDKSREIFPAPPPLKTEISEKSEIPEEIGPPGVAMSVETEIQPNLPKTKQFKNVEPPKKENFISEVSGKGILVKPELDILEEKEEIEKIDGDWLSWDLVHFLLLLSPYDEDEVTWWTLVLEAVKCSLRNCPNHTSHWHDRHVELPRITRHRRQDSEFSPDDIIPTTPKPCACSNLEGYFEKLYESIEKFRDKKNSTLGKIN